jgi:hypothetical protein
LLSEQRKQYEPDKVDNKEDSVVVRRSYTNRKRQTTTAKNVMVSKVAFSNEVIDILPRGSSFYK